MDVATTRTQSKGLSLPNMLTYARIAAIPVVVGCIYAQSILDGPLWLRWVAVAVFIAGGAGDMVVPVVTQIGLLLLWASAIFTIYTGYDYFRAGIHHLIKEDEG